MACLKCDAIEDITDLTAPYTMRKCDACGRKIKIRELGKHGIGFQIKKGDEVVIPASFISISANPLKGMGHLSRSGLAWFSELVFANNVFNARADFEPFFSKQIEEYDRYLRNSNLFRNIDFDGPPEEEKKVYDVALANKGTPEWFAFVAATLAATAKGAIANNDTATAAWATAASERFRSLWVFNEHFEEVVWMGQSARRLTEVLNLWSGQKTNADEGFWQIKLQEASYIFSQLFSVPITFIEGNAYVGGQQVDRKSARFVDFLFSGGSSGEAILIEIKTPVTPLMQRSKYRSSVHAPDANLSGAVVQAADYRNSVSRELQTVMKDKPIDISTFNPKVIIITGNYAELDTEMKRRSFELYRSSLTNIEIVTFDELFRKIEHLARLFNLVKSNTTPEGKST